MTPAVQDPAVAIDAIRVGLDPEAGLVVELPGSKGPRGKPVQYAVTVSGDTVTFRRLDGRGCYDVRRGFCTCPDAYFRRDGKPCKHVRAAGVLAAVGRMVGNCGEVRGAV